MSTSFQTLSAGVLPLRWAGDQLGRIGLPIGSKFLLMMLCVVGLMTLLALTGLHALWDANLRANAMINDHTKTASLNNLARTIDEATLLGTALFAGTKDQKGEVTHPGDFLEQLVWLHDTVDSNQLSIDRPSRFGSPERATELFQQAKELRSIGKDFTRLYQMGDVAAAKSHFELHFIPALLRFEAEVRKLNFDVRLQMQGRVETITTAYQSSRV